MKVKGLTETELVSAVFDVSSNHYGGNIRFKRSPERKGNFLFFTLTVKDSSKAGARRSASGRRIAAACWHAHRDIMAAIFAINPDAVLVSAVARYEGASGFYAEFPATGSQNIGSYANPCAFRDACECGPEIRNNTPEYVPARRAA